MNYGHSLGPNWHKNLDFKQLIESKTKKQINIKFNSLVDKIKENEQIEIILTNKEVIKTDVVIFAIGVDSNTNFDVFENCKFEKDSENAIKVKKHEIQLNR